MRRSRPAPSGFSIALTASQPTVTVENKSEEEVRNQLFIHGDDSMVSPIITSDMPTFACGPSGLHHHHAQNVQHHQAKFLHVNSTDIYVLVDGASLFQDIEVTQGDPLARLVDASSSEISFQSSTPSGMRQRVLRDLCGSGDDLFDQAIAEVVQNGRSAYADPTRFKDRPSVATHHPHLSNAPIPKHHQPHASVHKQQKHSCHRSWSSSDLEGLEILTRIGGGQQGSVHMARLRDGTRCAVKKIDITDATQATNDVERQGRKAGIVRELNMVKSLREHPSAHMVQLYNATCTLNETKKELNIFMELMGPSVEAVQKTVGRMPHTEVTRVMQKAFTKQLQVLTTAGGAGGGGGKQERLFTSAINSRDPVDRQTPVPDIICSFIAHDVLLALEELHAVHQRVHCDVKPANILIADDRTTFKLGDFGCAVKLNPHTLKVSQRGGCTLGSKVYRAPEQFSCNSGGCDIMSRSNTNNIITSSSSVGGGVANNSQNNNNNNNNNMGSASVSSSSISSSSTCLNSSGAPLSPLTALTMDDASETVVFDHKVDIWALGITLLELANGCHPTKAFQSDFWGYANRLSLKNMIIPVTSSPAFSDFIEKCIVRDPAKRCDAPTLLRHEFVRQYVGVSRAAVPVFFQKLMMESEQYQRNATLQSLRQCVVAATRTTDREKFKRQSAAKWKGFTHLLTQGAPPPATDPVLFPALGS